MWEDVAQLNLHDKPTSPIAELPAHQSPAELQSSLIEDAFPKTAPFSENEALSTSLKDTTIPISSTVQQVPVAITSSSTGGSNPWRKSPSQSINLTNEATASLSSTSALAIAPEPAKPNAEERQNPSLTPHEEHQPPLTPPRISIENVDERPAPSLPTRPREEIETLPPLPPRRSTSSSKQNHAEQRAEYYQVKKIDWMNSSGQLQQSPILVQNANGPCPLLALVNAYILSARTDHETSLVENLKLREHVSLGLLLDAVFEELTSGRRGEATRELPDLSELYFFLITLHSGMNVNPRFVTDICATNLTDAGNMDLSGMHPAFRSDAKPGCFDETKEMALYSAFAIPLIHGWIPPADSPTYDAFFRTAKTYEDTQNVLFREEELQRKLRTRQITAQEEQILQDIILIKDFLQAWPTQLTEYGLDIIDKSMKAGQFAILFRNDHFSTLYKDQFSERLFTLVTDAGYAGHERIIWESLVDVQGQANEFFSGDFQLIQNEGKTSKPQYVANAQPVRSLLDDFPAPNSQTAASPNAQPSSSQATQHDFYNSMPSQSSKTEQEDHDLALALQMQEEEEDRHRREQESLNNRRAERLSREYLSQDSHRDIRPLIPPRRTTTTANNNANTNNNTTSGTTSNNHSRNPSNSNSNSNNNNNTTTNSVRGLRVSTDATTSATNTSADAPPPAYSQAASEQPYIPPVGHPASPEAPLNSNPVHGATANTPPLPSGPAVVTPTTAGPASAQSAHVSGHRPGYGYHGAAGGSLGSIASVGSAGSTRQRLSRVSSSAGQAVAGVGADRRHGHGQGQGQVGMTPPGGRVGAGSEEGKEKCVVM